MRYIDADGICKRCGVVKPSNNCERCLIYHAITQDVVEKITGKWEKVGEELFCSECGNVQPTAIHNWFCSSCGAEMENGK